MSACALHNYLHTKCPSLTNHLLDKEDSVTHEFTPGEWRSQGTLESVKRLSGNTSILIAKRQRDLICDYVNGPGAVPWQNKVLE